MGISFQWTFSVNNSDWGGGRFRTSYDGDCEQMKNQTKFNWRCVFCGKRNLESWRFQFDVPKSYHTEVTCSKCGKENVIEFQFTVSAATK